MKRVTKYQRRENAKAFLRGIYSRFTTEWISYKDIKVRYFAKKNHIEGRLQRVLMANEFIIQKRKYKIKHPDFPTDEVIDSYLEIAAKQRLEEARILFNKLTPEQKSENYKRRYARVQAFRKKKQDFYSLFDQKALEEIDNNCRALLHKYSCSYDKDDLIQDSLLLALQKKEMFSPTSAKFSTWVTKIAQNLVMQKIQKDKRIVPVLPPPEEEREHELTDKEKLALRYYSVLTPSQKRLFELVGDGMRYADIAKKLNYSSAGYVKFLVGKLRKRIKTKINERINMGGTIVFNN